MKHVFLFVAALFLNAPSFAQQVEIKIPCDSESADIESAEYKPGVDVNGNPVVGADLSSNIKSLNYPIRIPVEIDVLQFLDIDFPDGVVAGEEQDVRVAYFDVFEDGRVEYNGQDVSSRVVPGCDDGEEPEIEVELVDEDPQVKATEDVVKPDQKDGQDASDSVVSGDEVEGKSP